MVANLIEKWLEDSKEGYSIIGDEYWFGRLCMMKDLTHAIERGGQYEV